MGTGKPNNAALLPRITTPRICARITDPGGFSYYWRVWRLPLPIHAGSAPGSSGCVAGQLPWPRNRQGQQHLPDVSERRKGPELPHSLEARRHWWRVPHWWKLHTVLWHTTWAQDRNRAQPAIPVSCEQQPKTHQDNARWHHCVASQWKFWPGPETSLPSDMVRCATQQRIRVPV